MSELDRIEATRASRESACRESGVFVTGDDRSGEADAAGLLGLAPATLANRRSAQDGPPWFRIGGAGHRVSYRLVDLAGWIEAQRCE